MPIDEWKKASDRARYGPATRAKGSKTGKGHCGLAPARKQRKQRHYKPTGAWSGSTVLWFGKHKGKPVRDVPANYLFWLSRQTSNAKNIQALAKWLRDQYIQLREQPAEPAVSKTCG